MKYRIEFHDTHGGGGELAHQASLARFPTFVAASRIGCIEANALAIAVGTDVQLRIYDQRGHLAAAVLVANPVSAAIARR